MKLILIIPIFSFCAFASSPKIKVLLDKELTSVKIQGEDLSANFHNTNKLKRYKGDRRIKFNCHSSKSDTSAKSVQIASLKSPSGIISWNDIKYKGEFHLVSTPKKNRCDLIHNVSLEDYVSSLLNKEMNHTWPIEALKAQAVAARTYAYQKIQTNRSKNGSDNQYDIINSEWHQVSGSLRDITEQTKTASGETEGLILMTKSGKLVPAFFHSKCGGRTILPRYVWGEKVAGYESVDCPFCNPHGKKSWKFDMTKDQFKGLVKKFLGVKKNKNVYMMFDQREKERIHLYSEGESKSISKAKFRSALGRDNLPSSHFDINVSKNNVEFSGDGFGHGVGMCQFGAMELAKRGYKYKDILKHYYPNFNLKKIY